MSATAEPRSSSLHDRQISATRLFDARRELVWKLWTDPQHVVRWWGPNGFRTTIQEMDVRPGGVWRFVLHGPDGTDYQNKIVYRDVAPPSRLTYSHVSGPVFDMDVAFDAEGQQTRVSVQMTFESAELRDKVAAQFGAAEGLDQTLGRLAEQLAKASSDEQFLISRMFDAPRETVWKAWTEPERLAQWFGPKGMQVLSSNNDLRPGGIYHYGMRTPDGVEIWGRWVYREVVPPERLVFINSFSDAQGGVTRHPMAAEWPLEMVTIVTFEARGERTLLTIRWSPHNATETERKVFASSHDSMQGGWSGTLEKLVAYLA